MIEIIIKNYLAEKLSMPVVLEVPADPPKSFILLEKTAAAVRRILTVRCWQSSPTRRPCMEAARLNERVKAAMDSAAELDAVSASRLNSDYNFTDTTTKRYRYQAVYDLVYYDE